MQSATSRCSTSASGRESTCSDPGRSSAKCTTTASWSESAAGPSLTGLLISNSERCLDIFAVQYDRSSQRVARSSRKVMELRRSPCSSEESGTRQLSARLAQEYSSLQHFSHKQVTENQNHYAIYTKPAAFLRS